MSRKRVARDVLPPTAMAAVDECLLLKGVKPTNEFAEELWGNLNSRMTINPIWRGNDMRVVCVTDQQRGGNGKLFIISLEMEAPPLRIFKSKLFPMTADGLINMSAFIKTCRALGERGTCPCDNPPKRMRLLSYDGCGECFLSEAR